MESIVVTLTSNGKEQTIKLEKDTIKSTDVEYIFLELKGDIEEGETLQESITNSTGYKKQQIQMLVEHLQSMPKEQRESMSTKEKSDLAVQYDVSTRTVLRRLTELKEA